MKLYYTSLAILLGSTLSFGQIQPTNSNSSNKQLSPLVNAGKEIKAANNSVSSTNASITETAPYSVPAGQHVCKSHELNEKHYAERGILKDYNNDYLEHAAMAASMYPTKTSGVNEISVIFHVVHNTNNPAENVSNALIMQVFNDLTEDYLLMNADAANARTGFGFNPANPNINFCLATQDPSGNPLTEIGVERVATSEEWYDSDNGEENKMKSSASGGADIWNRNKYLNVWICDISNGATSGTAGYAYRPTPTYLPGASIDGIVLDYNLGMNNDNVLTHEVGHYLGLDHTWGGSGSCSSDDGFTDTPNTEGPSFNYSGSCSGSQQTCGSTETQYENYMDYSNCTVMFTTEQSNFMLSILQGIRASLLMSPGCDPTNTPPNSAFTSMPSGPAPVIIPQNGAVNFLDQSTNAPTGWSWTISGTAGVDWNYINTTSSSSQNPEVEFYNIGLYNVTLTASNSFGADPTPAIEVGYVQVVGAATGIGCDTLRNYTPSSSYWTLSTADGYIHGNTTIGTEVALEWAEQYSAPASTKVKALEFAVNKVNDGGGNVIFKVYANTGGQPGAVMASESVPLANLTAGAWNNIAFTTPATVTGAFWVGYELSYSMTDTFALYSDYDPAPATNLTWVRRATPGWQSAGPLFGGSPAFRQVLDVLTSNGGDPVMDFTYSEDEICAGGSITVNGAGSVNNIDYRWYRTDDPWTVNYATSNSPAVTFTFPAAGTNYAIRLYGSGSCLNHGVYIPVTVDPAVSAVVTPTHTTCGNNNGAITISSPAGGNGTYSYSIDGVNYTTTPSFTNLPSGSYTVYVMTTGSGCETTYSITINASSPPNASSTSNVEICPGQSADITASGGTSYEWFDGSTSIGTTATVTVTPSATNQYTCVVSNGPGCQAIVYTTVTVGSPTATITTQDTMCVNGSAVSMTGWPSGGTFSGAGVTGSQFDPTVAGIGTHTVTYMYDDGAGCGDTTTVDIYVDGCAAITEASLAGAMLYPNPVTNELMIVVPGNFTYTIVDARGRAVSTGEAADHAAVNTHDYTQGVYMVTISNATNSATFRVIKE